MLELNSMLVQQRILEKKVSLKIKSYYSNCWNGKLS